jgi:hypothetical protein
MRHAAALWPIVGLLASSPAGAEAPFFEVANTSANFQYTHTLTANNRFSRFFGIGPAAADYDRDGDIDVFIPQAFAYPDALYRNNGDGTFTETAAAAEVAGLGEARAALWIDYDNDGWLDLFVANDPDAPAGQQQADPATTHNRLYRNRGDGTFEDVSELSGIDQMPNPVVNQTVGGLAAADINNDGYLDVYVSCWGCENALYLNNGTTFTEMAVAAGVDEPGTSWAPMFYDVDGDGWIDLLLNVDFGPNRLFINQQDNTFVDVAPAAGFDTAFNEMGMAIGDHDNDGDFDVLATNIEVPYPDGDPLSKYTVLFQNDSLPGAPAFTEIAQNAGVARTGWGWGCTWADCNNDGWLDLFVTNGFHQTVDYLTDPSRCFLNSGGLFAEAGSFVGFNSTKLGRGLIAFDYDMDGDLDLLETNYGAAADLFRNDTTSGGNWIAIDLIAAGPGNRFAVGAEITVTAGALTQLRLVTAGTSFLSQEPYRAFVGLGQADFVDTIHIRWPDGAEQDLANVRANRVAKIKQGAGLWPDLNLDDDLDDADVSIFVQVLLGLNSEPMQGIIADIDANGSADAGDMAAFVSMLVGP